MLIARVIAEAIKFMIDVECAEEMAKAAIRKPFTSTGEAAAALNPAENSSRDTRQGWLRFAHWTYI